MLETNGILGYICDKRGDEESSLFALKPDSSEVQETFACKHGPVSFLAPLRFSSWLEKATASNATLVFYYRPRRTGMPRCELGGNTHHS